MKQLKSSIIAWAVMAHGAIFTLLFFLLPDEPLKYLGYALVVGAGVAALWRWWGDFYHAFKKGRGGASFLIVGSFSLMAIVLLHRIVVVGEDVMPDLWIYDSKFLIRAVVWFLGGALLLLFFATDVNSGIVQPRSFVMLGIGIAIGGFLMGYSFAISTTARLRVDEPADTDIPVCLSDRPVWGTENGVYHLPGSPHRAMIKRPFRCFGSASEAESKGFRSGR